MGKFLGWFLVLLGLFLLLGYPFVFYQFIGSPVPLSGMLGLLGGILILVGAGQLSKNIYPPQR